MVRRRPFNKILSATAVALLIFGASVQAQDLPQKLPDTSRVVSIGDSITEIIFALGAENKLVARDTTSTYPQEAQKLPDVGYMRALSPEGVLSVNPTAIIAVEGSGPQETLDVLKKATVPFVIIPQEYNGQSVVDKIRRVGAAIGEPDKADALAVAAEKEITATENLTKNVSPRIRVLFILSSQGGKIMGSGAKTAANGIIEMAGAENAIADFDGYKPLSDESIIAARPDAILMMDRGGDHAASDAELLAHPAIATTPAGQNHKIIRVNGQYMLGFGPRAGTAARELAVALYGDQLAN